MVGGEPCPRFSNVRCIRFAGCIPGVQRAADRRGFISGCIGKFLKCFGLQLAGLLFPNGRQLITQRLLQALQGQHGFTINVRSIQSPLDRATAAQHSQQGMIIRRGNRIHLVVVTARTRHRRRLESLGQRVQLIVHDVVSNDAELHTTVVVHLSESVKGRADRRLVKVSRCSPTRIRQ